jgi:hypothetical protein
MRLKSEFRPEFPAVPGSLQSGGQRFEAGAGREEAGYPVAHEGSVVSHAVTRHGRPQYIASITAVGMLSSRDGTARAYLENSQLTAGHLDRHRRHGYQAEHPVDMLRVTYAYHGHHRGYCFDWAALSAELAGVGFVIIRRYEVGNSDDPAFRRLEQRDELTEVATQLVVEAWKIPVGAGMDHGTAR